MSEAWRLTIGGLSAPVAGLLFAVAWAGSGYAIALAARHLERRATPRALRVRFWSGWPFWGHLLGAGAGIAWLFTLLRLGVFVTSDAGVGHVAPMALWSGGQGLRDWLALTAASGGLILLLWLGYWRRSAHSLVETESGLSLLSLAVVTLGHQAALAILRAAAIPVVGVYWGIWVAAVAKFLLMRAHPQVRRRLSHGRRSFVYLEWALDWQSAALFALLGNLLMTTVSRLMVGGLLHLTHGIITGPGIARPEPDGSAKEPPATPLAEY